MSTEMRILAVVLTLLFMPSLGGCSTGSGEGTITAIVWAPGCNLEAKEIDLKPNFFSVDPVEDADILDFRIQHGSDFEDRSNGVSIQVSDAEALKTESLGVPLDLADPDSPIRMNFYLGQRCDDMTETPVNYEAVGGTIVFDALYVPWVASGERLSHARFTNVVFADQNEADTRHATADGEFSFLFERGRPAQRFP